MKKILALLLATLTIFAFTACGGNNNSGEEVENTIPDALTLLNTVWAVYPDDMRFAAAGGDFSEENMSMDGPGRFGLSDAAVVDNTLGLPEASVASVDDAASLMHMMNANTFTGAAYRLVNAGDANTVADAIKANLANRQWMCGFPDKLVVFSVENYVVSAFGNGEIIDAFKTAVQTAYSSAVLLVEEPLI